MGAHVLNVLASFNKSDFDNYFRVFLSSFQSYTPLYKFGK